MSGAVSIVLSQLVFAVGVLFAKKLTPAINPILATSVMVLLGALMLFPVLVYFAKDVRLLTNQRLGWAAGAAFCLFAFGELLYIIGVSKTTLSNVGIISLIFPLFATSLGIIFLNEHINFKFIFGSILMISGFLLLL